jgi:hypothetical protein
MEEKGNIWDGVEEMKIMKVVMQNGGSNRGL